MGHSYRILEILRAAENFSSGLHDAHRPHFVHLWLRCTLIEFFLTLIDTQATLLQLSENLVERVRRDESLVEPIAMFMDICMFIDLSDLLDGKYFTVCLLFCKQIYNLSVRSLPSKFSRPTLITDCYMGGKAIFFVFRSYKL